MSLLAYGLALGGPLVSGDVCSLLLLASPPASPEVRLTWDPTPVAAESTGIDDDTATVRCLFGGHLVARRRAMTATFRRETVPDAHTLAHPGMAAVGAVFARWLGRSAFHGGAFVTPEGAWGLVGEKGGGKSTTLAALALGGHEVLADDLVVVEGTAAFAGPRTLDLRPSAAEWLEGRLPTVLVRDGERHRVLLGATAPSAPLRGWIHLDDGNRVEVARVPPSRRLEALGRHLAVRRVPRDPTAFLELASLPAWRLRRPSSLTCMPAVTAVIGDIVAGG